jgi:predicted  nucleic acid-binding Zn-ribbon protein
MRKSVPKDLDGFVRKSELRRFISPDLTQMETKLMSAFEKLASEVLETKTLVEALRQEVAGFPAKLVELEAKLAAAEDAANKAADALNTIQNPAGQSMGGIPE